MFGWKHKFLFKIVNCLDRKLEYTRGTLMKFKEQMAQKAIQEKTGGDGGGMFGGFGGSGGDNAPAADQVTFPKMHLLILPQPL